MTQCEERKISNAETRPNSSSDPPPGDPGQAFGVAAPELPGTNHMPGVDMIPVRVDKLSLLGTQGAVIHNSLEGVQAGQGKPPPQMWRVPR